jgi:cytochrome c biogenesis protein CcmG/thiol:disulfide interchange protein DsbE
VSPGRLGVWLAVAAVLGFLVLVGNGMVLARAPDGGTAPGQQVNYTGGLLPVRERAPQPFTLRLFDGASFALAESRGRPVLVNFWASWCAPCRDEAPVLALAAKEWGARGVALVGVDVWDKEADARKFLEEFGLTYPNGVDVGGVAIDFGVRGIPETYVLDGQGVLRRRWIGPLSAESIQLLVGDLAR